VLTSSGGSPGEASSATIGGMVACGVASPPVGSDAVEGTGWGIFVARNASKYLELVITDPIATDEYKDKGGGATWYTTRARSSSVGAGCSRGWGAVPPFADGRGDPSTRPTRLRLSP
jgi:hypothetical protein